MNNPPFVHIFEYYCQIQECHLFFYRRKFIVIPGPLNFALASVALPEGRGGNKSEAVDTSAVGSPGVSK